MRVRVRGRRRQRGYRFLGLEKADHADRLDANISVKLTGLGLKLDLGLCRSLLDRLVRAAGDQGGELVAA